MAEQPKKPRKIKDLKARLGRTISPNTQQGGGAVPPPAVGGAAPPRGGGLIRPPSSGGGPVSGIPGVAPPPFGQPEPQKVRSADPFAAVPQSQAPPAPHEVRIVFDEKPVHEVEVGRKKRGLVFILVGVGAVLGIGIGFGAGNMRQDRNQYNLAVADGKDIYQTVRTASDVVTKAQRYVDSAVGMARGGPGKQPAVDYQAIEALQALEKPLAAGAFARKRYNAFNPQTVDALFEYYNNVNILWDKITRLANRTLPQARRQALDQAVEAAGTVATPTGCVPSLTDEQWSCGLVFVAPNPEGDGTTVMVRTRRSTVQQFPKTLFTGVPEDFAESPGNYVIVVDPERSIGVLGEQASDFADYSTSLSEIKGLLDRTLEVQGRLEQDLGEVASLEEIFNI